MRLVRSHNADDDVVAAEAVADAMLPSSYLMLQL